MAMTLSMFVAFGRMNRVLYFMQKLHATNEITLVNASLKLKVIQMESLNICKAWF